MRGNLKGNKNNHKFCVFIEHSYMRDTNLSLMQCLVINMNTSRNISETPSALKDNVERLLKDTVKIFRVQLNWIIFSTKGRAAVWTVENASSNLPRGNETNFPAAYRLSDQYKSMGETSHQRDHYTKCSGASCMNLLTKF